MGSKIIQLHRVFEVREIVRAYHYECLSSFLYKTAKNSSWTLLFAAAGNAELITEKMKKQGVKLKEGDLFLLSPGESFSVCGSNGSCPIFYEVEFNCGGISRLAFIKNRVISLEDNEKQLLEFFASECSKCFEPEVGDETEGSLSELAHQPFGGEQLAAMYLEQLLILLARRTGADRKEAGRLENLDLVRHVCDYYADHISEQMSIEKICEEFDIGKTTLEEAFKERLKSGAIEYFYRMRISEAKALIRSGADINSLAKALGYASSATFGRQFRRFTDMSPVEYRDKYLSEMENPVYRKLKM